MMQAVPNHSIQLKHPILESVKDVLCLSCLPLVIIPGEGEVIGFRDGFLGGKVGGVMEEFRELVLECIDSGEQIVHVDIDYENI